MMLVCILALLAVVGRVRGSDPCNNPTILKDSWRLETNGMNPMMCDKNLAEGWYRFQVPGGNGRMPHVPDENNANFGTRKCGTYLPVIFVGDHPKVSDGVVERQQCVSYDKHCLPRVNSPEYRIKIKNCGTFYIYYLRPLVCQLAYCAAAKGPDEVLQPVLSGVEVGKNGDFMFKCYHQSDGKDYKVTWYADDDIIQAENIQGKSNEVSTLPVKLLNKHFNKKLTCAITVGKIQSDRSPSFNLELSSRFRSVKRSVMREADEDDVILESTIPIVCEPGEACDVQLRIDDPDSLVVVEQCKQALNQMIWDAKDGLARLSFKLQAVNDYDAGRKRKRVKIDAVTSYSVVFPGLSKEIIQTGTETCNPHGDPHFTSFENKMYHNYKTGEFTMYQDEEKDVEIHAVHNKCNSRATCVCGFTAREGSEIVKLEVCNNDRRPNVVLEGDDPKTRVFSDKSGKRYRVFMPSGNYINARVVNGRTPYFDMNIQQGKPHRKLRGTCVKLNDTFVGPNDRVIQPRSAKFPDEFFDAWRTQEMMLTKDPREILKKAKTAIHQAKTHCKCDVNGRVQCDKNFNYKTSEMKYVNTDGLREITENLKHQMRRRRNIDYNRHTHRNDLQYSDFEKDKHVSKRSAPTWPTASGITEMAARRHCSSLLSGAKATACQSVLSVTKDAYVDNCMEDIFYFDGLEAGQAIAGNLDAVCKDALIDQQKVNEKPDGTLAYPKEFESFCPNMCNLHGKCKSGKCICYAGYGSEDCSVNLKEPPTVDGFIGGQSCDASRVPCFELYPLVSNVLNTTTLRCLYSTTLDGKLHKLSMQAKFVDFRQVSCEVPFALDRVSIGKEQIRTLDVTLTNDVKTFSKPLSFTIYSSQCYACNRTGTCKLKPRKCVINGECYNGGDTSPRDNSLSCIPSISTDHWVDAAGVIHS